MTTVAEAYLEEREPDLPQVVAALRRACIERRVVPVLCGCRAAQQGGPPVAGRGGGLPAVARRRPPGARRPIRATGSRWSSDRRATGSRSLRSAFKVAMDEGRKVVFLRVFSGKLEPGRAVYNARAGANEKIAPAVQRARRPAQRLDERGRGQHRAGGRAQAVHDRRHAVRRGAPILLERIDAYEPVISIAIEPKNQQAKKKLDFALGKMVEEDPTFRVREDPETGQTLISGMGELHLQVVVERLRREYKVEAAVGKPQVVYRETIGATAEAAARFERELKEATLFGEPTR